jgi:branched-chain amino acid aminotransferase
MVVSLRLILLVNRKWEKNCEVIFLNLRPTRRIRMLRLMFFINGKIVAEEDAKIPILDLGVLRGYGVFDYLRTYNKRPFHLIDHLERLRFSAEEIGITLPYSLSEIEEIVELLLRKTDFPESSIKIIATGGSSSDFLMPEGKPSFFVHVYPFKGPAPSVYANGIRAITTPLTRPVPTVKTIHYIAAIMALQKGRKQKAEEALYVNQNREILEGTTCNFFGIKNGELITPSSEEILFGITRALVLRLATMPVTIRPIREEELPELDEAFVTSSSKEIVPLVAIDQTTIGNGSQGPITKQLMESFSTYALKGDWSPVQISRYGVKESVDIASQAVL